MRHIHRLLVLLALASCTDALLQPGSVKETTLDDRLALRGKVCTNVPDPSAFPVKVVFLIDSSGSMCVSDGPGSQASAGFCETIGATLRAQGITTPGRVRALHSLIDRFAQQGNVFVSLVPFDSKITGAYPPMSGNGPLFVPASDGSLGQHIDDLQSTLGKGTDYQGALAHAYMRIDADVQKSIDSGQRSSLPRTKYVVILLTDGTPYPRCTSNDSDPDPTVYASPDAPWGIYKDNPASFCNPLPDGTDPNAGSNGQNSVISDYVIGTDRNQNYQLFDPVDRLMGLKDKYNVGELRLHTILLFNIEAVIACGQICLTDLYNGVNNINSADDAHKVAAWMLQEMAVKHGNGTYQEFTKGTEIELGSLDYTSLASRFVQKTLLAANTNAYAGQDGPELDSDGDGVPDTLDSDKVLGTNHLSTDSDGDGFPDGFEIAHKAQGFDPLKPDMRGCKNGSGFTAKFSCRDTDGDGLSQAIEAYLGTDPILPDTDADGIPDGVEVALGLDPLVPNSRLMDVDLDGVPDVLEVFQHTNPLLDDRLTHVRDGYRYQLTEKAQADGSVCYDFLVSNIRLMTPDSIAGQHGFNFITLTFAEAPEGGVTRDYGAWKQACIFAQFAPPSQRRPEGPEVQLVDSDFVRFDAIQQQTTGTMWPANFATVCKGVHP